MESPRKPTADEPRTPSTVRLRLHHQGRWEQVPESGEWRYTGGSAFNDTLPVTLTYSELCQRVNAKVGEACSIRYQAPGEPLDPDALVNVTDDDDLQELYNEYMEALARPDTPARTLRIHVYLAAALQFEIEREGDDDASLCCYDNPEELNDFPFEDLASDVNSSCDPSSDTALGAAGSQHHLLPAGMMSSQLMASAGVMYAALMAGGSAPVLSGGRSSTPAPGDASRMHAYMRGDAHAEARWPGQPFPVPTGFEQHALLNLNRSLLAAPILVPPGPYAGGMGISDGGHAGYPLLEEPQVEDPYEEEDPAVGHRAAQAVGGGYMAAGGTGLLHNAGALAGRQEGYQVGAEDPDISAGGELAALCQKGLQLLPNNGPPLYNKPLDRVRDGASGLPSHISAFGDSRDSVSGAEAVPTRPGGKPTAGGASLNLPSHISAFGDGAGDDAGVACMSPEVGVAQPPRIHANVGDTPDTKTGRVLAWEGSQHCITQEFGMPSGGSMSASPDDALPPRPSQTQPADGAAHGGAGGAGHHHNHNNSMPEPPATPKVTLLGSMQHVPRTDVGSCSKIGEGAFGEVSCAEVFPFGQVAIKWLKRDRFAKYSESFQREAQVLARLNHPNIIRMFGLVTEPATSTSPPGSVVGAVRGEAGAGRAGSGGGSGGGNSPGAGVVVAGIMMEYLRGGSLAQRFRTLATAGRRLSLRDRCRIARQAALGMAYLHDQSPAVIHFDLKPDNLLLEGDNEANLLVKVADFGLSKLKIQSYVTCHDLRGTLPYMAPELVRNPNQVCEKCDVWSMGVVCWEMFTLEVPFQELTAQDILRGLMSGTLHLRTPPGIEPEWQRLIEACMEPEPSQRPTFRQLAERLEDISRRLAAQEAQELLAVKQQQAQAQAHAQAQAQAQAHVQFHTALAAAASRAAPAPAYGHAAGPLALVHAPSPLFAQLAPPAPQPALHHGGLQLFPGDRSGAGAVALNLAAAVHPHAHMAPHPALLMAHLQQVGHAPL